MEGPSLIPPQLEPQRLILRRFVVLQFELQRFVVEKVGPQRPIPQRFVVLQLGRHQLEHEPRPRWNCLHSLVRLISPSMKAFVETAM
jgi:hypothetical protein